MNYNFFNQYNYLNIYNDDPYSIHNDYKSSNGSLFSLLSVGMLYSVLLYMGSFCFGVSLVLVIHFCNFIVYLVFNIVIIAVSTLRLHEGALTADQQDPYTLTKNNQKQHNKSRE